MRGTICCLVACVLAVAAHRHFGLWPSAAAPARAGAAPWWGALSFALAAVVGGDREG